MAQKHVDKQIWAVSYSHNAGSKLHCSVGHCSLICLQVEAREIPRLNSPSCQELVAEQLYLFKHVLEKCLWEQPLVVKVSHCQALQHS